MRNTLFLSTALAAAFASPAHAEKWFLVGEGDEDLFYADADSVTKSGQYLQMEVIDSLSDPIVDSAGSTYYYRGQVNFDCSGGQFKNLVQNALGADGAALAQFDPQSAWEVAGPGTHAEALLKFACEGGYRETPITDPFSYSEDYWYYYYSDDEAAPTPS